MGKVRWNTRKVARSPFRTLERAKKAERDFWAKKPIGFTARSSLKSMGRIPRASGNYILGKKYKTCLTPLYHSHQVRC